MHGAAADQLLAGLRTRLEGGAAVCARATWSAPAARDESDLDGGRLTDAWAHALTACVDVTRGLFAGGRAVCDGVTGRLRLELRLTWLGGRRVLDRVAEHQHDLLTRRPTLRAADVPRLLWQAARWGGVAA